MQRPTPPSRILPRRGAESLARGQDDLNGGVLHVHGGENDVVAPPRGGIYAVEGEGEEDDEGAEGEAEVQARRGEEVEAAPPAEVPVPDPVLEDEADDAPREVVEGRGRRDGAGAAKDERGHEVLERRLGPAAGGEVDDDGHDGADAEEDEQARVHMPGGEDASGADESPDHGGCLGNWGLVARLKIRKPT